MNEDRRGMLGLALLAAWQPAWALGAPVNKGMLARGARTALERELAAIVRDPACELASLSVLAIRHGAVSYSGRFGRSRIGPDRALAPDALFRIASVSKMMTTLGLMRLVDAGRVALDADVSRYLGFSLRNPHFPAQAITLRDLLTHTASLRDDAGYSWAAPVALRDILVPGASLYGDGRMWSSKAAPGAYFTYCNLGFGLVGTIMEAVTGERFDRLMRRLLLEPLGLRAGYNPAALTPATIDRIATLYRKRTVDTEVWDPDGPWIAQADDIAHKPPAAPPGIEGYVIGSNATPFSPTGGLRISASGLGVIMRMLMRRGVHGGRRILSEAALARMFRREWTYDGNNGDTMNGFYRAWGLGNQQFPDGLVDEPGFGAAVGHLGDAYGLVSSFVADLEHGNGMVVLVGGSATDPQASANHGRYSALPRFQECILETLYRRAILVQ